MALDLDVQIKETVDEIKRQETVKATEISSMAAIWESRESWRVAAERKGNKKSAHDWGVVAQRDSEYAAARARRDAAIASIDILNTQLKQLQDQKAVQIAAGNEVIFVSHQQNANALSADQNFQLQLAQNQAATQVATNKSLAAEKTASDNKKYYIIGGIVVVILVIVGIIIYKRNKS